MTETYENFQVLQHKERYEEHRWNIYTDLNFAKMLTVLQGGCPKSAAHNVKGTAEPGRATTE
jgi:hypothetical protein